MGVEARSMDGARGGGWEPGMKGRASSETGG